MAIALDIVALSGGTGQGRTRMDFVEFPPVKVFHVAAAGAVNIDVNCRLLQFRNGAAGDPVFLRVQDDADSTQASGSDSKTIVLKQGEVLTVGVDEDEAGAGLEVDIRAVS